MDDVPSFDAFYEQINSRSPLPWQSRLAAAAAQSRWPEEVGVPTGLGKTACLDIAVWALARQAQLSPERRSAPLRTWYVVDRRLLVDAAYDHGLELARQLQDAVDGPIAAVAGALRQLSGGAEGSDPLHVVRLRGGAELGVRPPHPAQPALCFATVAMYASRWLFRGYGTSTLMRPVDAALAGIDSLVLLDEAHLAPALNALPGAVAACDAGDADTVLPAARARTRQVALTATGSTRQRFDLDDDDRRHDLVQRRLGAAKPTELVTTKRKQLTKAMTAAALRLVAAAPWPGCCLLFSNTVATAAAVAKALEERDGDAEVVVLTGRLRSREADQVRARLLSDDGVRAGRPTRRCDRALFVVATQTLEVGADLDADHLVTESAGVRALTQRFGRLNRLGDCNHATAAIVHQTDERSWPVYGTEPADVWERLLAHAETDGVDLGPGNIGRVLGEPADRPARAGALLPIHLWEWAKTTVSPHGEAPVEIFFSGIDSELARVSIIWRAWLPEPGERCIPAPSQQEAVEVPIRQVRDLLDHRADELQALRTSDDGTTLEPVTAASVRPGDTLLLPTIAGGYDNQVGFDPDAADEVLDVSPLVHHQLALRAEVLRHLLPTAPASDIAAALAPLQPQPDEPVGSQHRRDAASAVGELLRAHQPREGITDDEWRTVVSGIGEARIGVPEPGDTTICSWQQRTSWSDTPVAADVFDDLTFDATSTRLDDHCQAVGELAGRIAEALGIPPHLQQALRLAGQFHDAGKAEVRFQRWLDPAGDRPLLAKSAGTQRESRRQAAGWPAGGRHELLSSRLLRAAIEAGLTLDDDIDAELVQHLVVSHHGYGRPSIRTVADLFPTTLTVEVLGLPVTVPGDLAQDDWSQPARFRQLCETYGYWGLALLEAILRQADHVASSTVEVS